MNRDNEKGLDREITESEYVEESESGDLEEQKEKEPSEPEKKKTNNIMDRVLKKFNFSKKKDEEKKKQAELDRIKFSSLFEKKEDDEIQAETPFTKRYKQDFVEYVLKKDVKDLQPDIDDQEDRQPETSRSRITKKSSVFDFQQENVFKDESEYARNTDKPRSSNKKSFELTMKKMYQTEYFDSKNNSDKKSRTASGKKIYKSEFFVTAQSPNLKEISAKKKELEKSQSKIKGSRSS
jgi:hypothetical protein